MFKITYPLVFLLWPLAILFRFLPPYKRGNESLYFPYLFHLKHKKKGVQSQKKDSLFKIIFLLLIWTLLLFALSAPREIGKPEKRIKKSRVFLINVDISTSMNDTDWPREDSKLISRWEGVRDSLIKFLETRKSDRVGLIVFGSGPYVQTPFTSDTKLVSKLLQETEVGMAGVRTALGDSIAKGIGLYKDSPEIENKVMFLITDGVDSGSQIRPIEAAQMAKEKGIKIYTLGIGKTTGSYALDTKTLKAVAEQTGGAFFTAYDGESLQRVTNEIDKLEPIEYEENGYTPYKELYYYPLGLSIALIVLYLFSKALIGLIHNKRRKL